MPVSLNELRRTTLETARERFGRDRIADLALSEDVDEDGAPYLRIRIVYNEQDGGLDRLRAFEFVRHLRAALQAVGEERFPLVSYVSRADFDGGNPAAA